jgi:hypothetical protein
MYPGAAKYMGVSGYLGHKLAGGRHDTISNAFDWSWDIGVVRKLRFLNNNR